MDAQNPWPLRGFAAGLLVVCLFGAWEWREQCAAIERLQADVLALQQLAEPKDETLPEEEAPAALPRPARAPTAAAAKAPAPFVPMADPAPLTVVPAVIPAMAADLFEPAAQSRERPDALRQALALRRDSLPRPTEKPQQE